MAVEAVRTAGVFLAELLLRWMDLVTDLLLFLVNLCKRRRSVPPIRDPLLLQSATALAANIRQGKVTAGVYSASLVPTFSESL
ncbi:hypothetical protein HPB47_011281 [Ixodes persulcatus]|uniref:Uncharacterized protein n=1 Tax=Ixodes persulcatus TaxID=34615 RepID=A0AC60NWV5_IXOPE|nr:hypothetical protein HPB47_011281 [Ixodes persulcatus]